MTLCRFALTTILMTLFASALAQSNAIYKDLHDFGGTVINANGVSGPDGREPLAPVTFDTDGNAYGTASIVGAFGSVTTGTGGTIWKIGTSGEYSDLFDFGASAYQPKAGVTFDSKGNMWGTVN